MSGAGRLPRRILGWRIFLVACVAAAEVLYWAALASGASWLLIPAALMLVASWQAAPLGDRPSRR